MGKAAPKDRTINAPGRGGSDQAQGNGLAWNGSRDSRVLEQGPTTRIGDKMLRPLAGGAQSSVRGRGR
jgi:hypothetical protein